MKKNKILLTVMVLLFGAIQVNAQINFGLKGGLNFASQIAKYGGNTLKSDILTGVHLGATAAIPLSETLFLEPGLLFSVKGGIEPGGVLKDKYTYIELPVNLVYKHPLGDDMSLLGYGGAYAGFLLSAKEKDSNSSTDLKSSSKGSDFGINLGAGLEISQLRFTVQYSFGLANITPVSSATLNNRAIGLSIGYRFGN